MLELLPYVAVWAGALGALWGALWLLRRALRGKL